jgi:hypothetical protein
MPTLRIRHRRRGYRIAIHALTCQPVPEQHAISNTKNSSDRTTDTAGIHRGPADLSLNMHSQQSMNNTHWAARGDMASAAIPVSISATATQCRTGQHTAADGVRAHWEAQPHRRADATPSEGRSSQAGQREDGTWEAAEHVSVTRNPQRLKFHDVATRVHVRISCRRNKC